MPDEFGRLTTHDLAFGIGRKATDEELRELFTRPEGETIDSETARKRTKEHLQKRRDERKRNQK